MSSNNTPVSAKTEVDFLTWPRTEIFHFFRNFEDPFFHVTVPVPVTGLKANAGKGEGRFFLSYLHAALAALNQTPALKLRFHREGAARYETIHAGCTILRADNTFGFVFFPWHPDREAFIQEGILRIQEGKNATGLTPFDERPDVAFFSVLPWISFTSFKNAHRHSQDDGFPRIVFGKAYQQVNEWYLPVALEVHHALVDGVDAGMFYQNLEKNFQQEL